LTIEKPTAARASFQANYTVTGGTEADLTYQWYWRGEKLVGATNKTFAFPTLTIPSATTAEELKVEVAPRTQRSDSRTRAQAEAPTPVSATLALKSSIAWNAPLGQSTWYDMAKACASQSNGNKRPGTVSELQALNSALGNMQAYGVNVSNPYWTGTRGSSSSIGQNNHSSVQLSDGVRGADVDTATSLRGLCVAGSVSAPSLGGLRANGYTHSASSGFPSMGFTGAQFYIAGLDNQAYVHTYRSLTPAVAELGIYNSSVFVNVLAKGNGSIEVYNGAGGNPVVLNYNVNKWFRESGTRNDINAAKQACGVNSTTLLPTLQELTTANISDGPASRGVGSLFGEWGSMNKWGWTFRGDSWYWTGSVTSNNQNYYDASLANGDSHYEPPGKDLNGVCISR
jgi:adhesin/invasin